VIFPLNRRPRTIATYRKPFHSTWTALACITHSIHIALTCRTSEEEPCRTTLPIRHHFIPTSLVSAVWKVCTHVYTTHVATHVAIYHRAAVAPPLIVVIIVGGPTRPRSTRISYRPARPGTPRSPCAPIRAPPSPPTAA